MTRTDGRGQARACVLRFKKNNGTQRKKPKFFLFICFTQKASYRQLNARLNNFAEFVAARRTTKFSTRCGGGWQNGEASGSKTLNNTNSQLHSTEKSNLVLTFSQGEASGRVAVLNGGAANSAGENKFGFDILADGRHWRGARRTFCKNRI